jgi:predicted transposase YdaD
VADNLASGKITRIYLEDFINEELPIALTLAVLTIRDGEAAIEAARQTIARAAGDRAIIDLVSTIIVYKFTELTRDEVNRMLGVELSQSRVYRDAVAEGKIEGKVELLMLLLNRLLGEIPLELSVKISQLPPEKLQKLGEDLLGFKKLEDLGMWLAIN